MMKRTFELGILTAIISIAAGCQFSQKATQEVTAAELDLTQRLQQRVARNEPYVVESLDLLGQLSNEYAAQEHRLALNISKAKLLDSLQSLWSSANPDLEVTRRAVALYYLFSLAQAEHEVVESKMAARTAAIQAIKDDYGTMGKILTTAAGRLQVIKAEFEKTKTEQVRQGIREFFLQTQAFREQLASSDNPKLKALASRVEKAEQRAEKAQEQLDQVLNQAAKFQQER